MPLPDTYELRRSWEESLTWDVLTIGFWITEEFLGDTGSIWLTGKERLLFRVGYIFTTIGWYCRGDKGGRLLLSIIWEDLGDSGGDWILEVLGEYKGSCSILIFGEIKGYPKL